jgi:hypothetical protein
LVLAIGLDEAVAFHATEPLDGASDPLHIF